MGDWLERPSERERLCGVFLERGALVQDDACAKNKKLIFVTPHTSTEFA